MTHIAPINRRAVRQVHHRVHRLVRGKKYAEAAREIAKAPADYRAVFALLAYCVGLKRRS